jgi:phosphoribosylanthranilate isomerase
MITRVKICGVTLADDAARVAAAGADFIGLNFWPKSKRYLAPERAPMLAAAARASGRIGVVGVFVDAELDDIRKIHREVVLDILQLHGDETPEELSAIARALKIPLWKAIAAGSPRDVEHLEGWPTDAILLDAPTPGRGGAGKPFDWELAKLARRQYPARKIVLAGGLTPDTVTSAIDTVRPWTVDVASGVEAGPGIKDPAKVTAFVAAVRAADQR